MEAREKNRAKWQQRWFPELLEFHRLDMLIRRKRYEEALAYIRQDPTSLTLVTFFEETLLHVLCRCLREGEDGEDKAIALAQEMLRLRPQLISATDVEGMTPLHIAVERGDLGEEEFPRRSARMALFLIHTDSATVNATFNVFVVDNRQYKTSIPRTPFHLACQANIDISVLKSMLDINPALASQFYQTPGLVGILFNAPLNLWFDAHMNDEDDSAPYEGALLIVQTAFHERLVESPSMEYLAHAMCCSCLFCSFFLASPPFAPKSLYWPTFATR